MPTDEPQPPKYDVLPEPPMHLDTLAQAVFSDVCVILHEADLLTTADIYVVEVFADAYSQWVQNVQARDAYKCDNHRNDPALVKACRDSANDCNRWFRVLGLGPAYRAGLVANYGLGGDQTNAGEVEDPVILGICGS